jgi:hypothetical protein
MGFQLKNCGVRKRKLRKNMNIKNWSVIGTGAMLFVALGFNVNSKTAVSESANFGGVLPPSDEIVNEQVAKPAVLMYGVSTPIITANLTFAKQQLTVYWYTASGPYDLATNSFLAWSDDIVKGFSRNAGDSIVTGSRSNNPTAVEFKSNFEAGDATIPGSTTTNCMWRFTLDPTNQYYVGQLGNLIRFPIIAIGNGVKISLSGLSWNITEKRGGTLNNNASNINSPYGRTKVGIITGPSGNPFGNDASFLENGEAGTNLVDVIVLSGARCGFWANGQPGLDSINDYITTNGDMVTCTYSYQTGNQIETYSKSIMLYRQGQIPESRKGKEIFRTPVGELFTLANEPEDQTWDVWVARNLISSSLNTNRTPYFAKATTGYHYTWPFLNNGTNDTGFVRFELHN